MPNFYCKRNYLLFIYYSYSHWQLKLGIPNLKNISPLFIIINAFFKTIKFISFLRLSFLPIIINPLKLTLEYFVNFMRPIIAS